MSRPHLALMDRVVNTAREARLEIYMSQNIHAQIAAMGKMTPSQLRDKYLEVFGEPTRSGNREHLFKRIAWRLQSHAEGGLSERAKQRAAELAREADIRTTIPRPPSLSHDAITRVITTTIGDANHLPMPGAVLTRHYKGRTVQVTVLPTGFDYEGQVYRSLSAVAKAVTGSHWNGNAFFGINAKGKP